MGTALGLTALLGLFWYSHVGCSPSADWEAEQARQKAQADSLAAEAEKARIAQALEDAWVEEKWLSMSEDQRLGQLFMIDAYPNGGAADEARVKQWIKQYHPGGIIFFQGSPTRMAALGNAYQEASKTPLLLALDAEWGPNMRLDSTIQYPRQLLLGAIQDHKMIYQFGRRIGYECKRLGLHINFAPVVDVNSNRANPVIGDRSFGEDRDNVSAKAFQYMKGMQDEGLIACAKHFPGHGDTDTDSHHDLPVIMHNRARLDSIELYPFRQLIQHGVGSIMVAHLQVPALDSTPKLPTTFSRKVVQELLKDSMGYEGLVITDALTMQGAVKHYKNGETDYLALRAGNDILLMGQNPEAARQLIKAGLAKGELDWKDLEKRIRKILRAKYRQGLHNYQPVDLKNLTADLQAVEGQVLKEQLILQALTLTDNPETLIPLRQEQAKGMACVTVNSTQKGVFEQELSAYGLNEQHYVGNQINAAQLRKLEGLAKKAVVVVALKNLVPDPRRNFNLSPSVQEFVQDLSTKTKVIVVAFGSPYALGAFDHSPWLVAAYGQSRHIERLTAQALFGSQRFEGKLPVSASAKVRAGMGVQTDYLRLPYAQRPEEVGLDSRILGKMDDIAKEMIKEKAAPGCQVLVVKNGKIAWHKTYGHHRYGQSRAVSTEDIYDLASVTKVAATTISVMKLYEEGKISLDKTLGDYLPELRGTNKAPLVIREVLAHHAGLKAWIPFYTKTLDDNKRPQDIYFRRSSQGAYCVRVAEGMYMCYKDIDSLVWQRIYDSEVSSEKKYVYSDLGFLLLGRLVEKVSGKALDVYASETFYQPMGLHKIGFNPLLRGFPKGSLPPTEEDNYFRYQMVQGDVHDMAAAMLGGVAGHAGLFATAADLAAVFQMLVEGGTYQGRRYLKAETIALFTAPYKAGSELRGLGVHRKEPQKDGTCCKNLPAAASDQTFGHMGFTGIGAWADPDTQTVFLFLSNRTYPSGENMKLVQKDTRRRMHALVYEAMKK